MIVDKGAEDFAKVEIEVGLQSSLERLRLGDWVVNVILVVEAFSSLVYMSCSMLEVVL